MFENTYENKSINDDLEFNLNLLSNNDLDDEDDNYHETINESTRNFDQLYSDSRRFGEHLESEENQSQNSNFEDEFYDAICKFCLGCIKNVLQFSTKREEESAQIYTCTLKGFTNNILNFVQFSLSEE